MVPDSTAAQPRLATSSRATDAVRRLTVSASLAMALLLSACSNETDEVGAGDATTPPAALASGPAGGDATSANPATTDTPAGGDAMSATTAPGNTFFGLSAPSITGEPVDLGQYRGKVLVVVNTASKCGFTPQYAGLQALHESMKDSGVVVLGFPSNDFMNQEPGTNEEIMEFCQENYGVTFPMFSKVQVKPGSGQSPVYAFLQSKTGETPGWNFCKYVVSADGSRVHFFGSRTKPDSEDLLKAINDELAAAGPTGAASSG